MRSDSLAMGQATDNPRARRLRRDRNRGRPRLFIIGGLLMVAVVWAALARSWGVASITFPHIHGLAFTPDGEQLIVPAHDGFRIYSEMGWQDAQDLPRRDYMGYSPVDFGFYSSGHPAPGGQELNPLGLVHSADLGESMTQLGLVGESDFHLMAVGYYSHAIYVVNPAPNSRMAAGVHYSLDNGSTWNPTAMNGIETQLYQLAVHPTEPNIVAASTQGGLYVSTDFGGSFALISEPLPVTAAVFSPAENVLLYGTVDLQGYDLATEETTSLNAPDLDSGDAIVYLAISPVDASHIAAATGANDIFYSTDGGATWLQIANNGIGK
ncbi:MAG: F510_1955 family glycosylhydrolase [Anaerolineales bacterium]